MREKPCKQSCSQTSCIAIQDKIQKSMAKDMVEPKRKYIDIEATWKKQLLKKASGPGGLLIMTIVQARDLRYQTSQNSADHIDLLCRLHPLTETEMTSSVFPSFS